ncbi:MAG TPA: ATP-binding protein [Verrucomicrobiae bacterium]|nr:ATP-binding protein [Verrucomicrobiae bacterium]
MKPFKSIKWRLQLWYGLILVAVLTGFGFTAYQLERGKIYRQIDDELMRRLSVLAVALHPPAHEHERMGDPPFGGPPPERDMSEGLPDDHFRPQNNFHPPAELAGLFDSADPRKFYFIISFREGGEPVCSTNAPAEEARTDFQNSNAADHPPDPNFLHSATAQTVGLNREIIQQLSPGVTVRVGCTTAPALKEFHLLLAKLAGIGAVILFFGLAGGWWLVASALKPISTIGTTATKISAGDLSQRISIAETESELGQLAAVLNSTFARLETAFVQQKQFASDAAHELRTPVSVILTQTQTALNREREAADYKQTIEACQRAAQRMRKLIESLLELTRFDAGQEILNRVHFDFSKTISDCAELVRPLADERNVKIISELSPLEITGDSERLAQVVTNLLTNAIQYNKSSGEVRVKLDSQNHLVVLKISDTGHGISPADLPRVFERFYRTDKSRTGGGNTGLGLSICKAIIEAHGGTIEVSSEENVGTAFTVRLPV